MYMQIDPVGAWDRLRASRSERPGRATGGARAKTYGAALEQAQQMFRAAEGVGPQTRALLIFYGLSQAGRAIAAAAVDLKEPESWKLNGHGIQATGFDKPFAETELRTETAGNSGSFVRLSELLDSPVWGKDSVVRMGDLWDSLPLEMPHPLSQGGRVSPLYASDGQIHSEPHPYLTVHVGEFPDRVVDVGTPKALDEFLTSYPGTTGYSYVRDRMGSDNPSFERHHPDKGWLIMHWDMGRSAPPEERLQRLHTMTRDYAGHRYFFPALPGLSRDLHPLMAWWAVLYTLSMLTRYQPAQWASHINIDAAQHAILIEKLLVLAMEQLPVLIADTIDDVAAWPEDDGPPDDR